MARTAKTAAKAPRAKAAPPSRVKTTMVEFTPGTAGDALTNSGATKTGKLYMVDLDNIAVMPGFNLRVTDTQEYKDGIRELADSIKSEGFYDTQPLGVFPAEINGETKLVLISGHRRYEAAKLAISESADIARLPVVLKKPGSTDLQLAMSLHKENTHVRPTMLERAVLANRMAKAGMDDDDIAAHFGVTNKHVRDLKVIMNAPRGVRDLIRDGKIAAYEAIATSFAKTPAAKRSWKPPRKPKRKPKQTWPRRPRS